VTAEEMAAAGETSAAAISAAAISAAGEPVPV
jgi:hypothetical protein